jgi:hypothetical protein
MTTHIVVPGEKEEVEEEIVELSKTLEERDALTSHRPIRTKRIFNELSEALDNIFAGDVLYLREGTFAERLLC